MPLIKPPIRGFSSLGSLAVKLSALFVREISRPVAMIIRTEALKNTRFRCFCVSLAQNVNYWDNSLKNTLSKGPPLETPPLDEDQAIDNVSRMISESIFFLIACWSIVYESNRQKAREKQRRDALASDLATLQGEIDQLKSQLALHSIKVEDYHVPDGYNPSFLQLTNDRRPQSINRSESQS